MFGEEKVAGGIKTFFPHLFLLLRNALDKPDKCYEGYDDCNSFHGAWVPWLVPEIEDEGKCERDDE